MKSLIQNFHYKSKGNHKSAGNQRRPSFQGKNIENNEYKPKLMSGLWRVETETSSIVIEREPSLWDVLKQDLEFYYGHVRFRLMDINCMSYLGLVGLLLIFFHKAVANWPIHVLVHVIFIIIILQIIRLGEMYAHNKILWILRTFYPVVVFLYGWNELNSLICMFYGDYWTTDNVAHLDKLIFGVHPTVWIRQFYRPWLDELMNFFYSGYYFFMPIVSLTLFIKRKREETLAAFSVVSFAYLSNFILFYIFPTLAPSMMPAIEKLQTSQYSGYVIAGFTRLVQAHGAVRGGAFPSSHITGVLVWSLMALRYQRKLGYILMPMTLGVAVSTVYLGYHHAVDPICGFIWGSVCYLIAMKLIKQRREEHAR